MINIQKHNNRTGVSAKLKNNSLYAALKANIVKVVNTPHARDLLDLQQQKREKPTKQKG